MLIPDKLVVSCVMSNTVEVGLLSSFKVVAISVLENSMLLNRAIIILIIIIRPF